MCILRVLRDASVQASGPTALTIGNFDGVHLGHRALLSRIRDRARALGVTPAVLTFEPHPREFFMPQSAPPRLSTLREKLELLAQDGIELVRVCHFNTAFAALTAEAFIEEILLRQMRVRYLIVGDDFCFGAKRSGNFAMLQAAGRTRGFTVETMDSVLYDGERVSSSLVRAALAAGEMEKAAGLLGRPYIIDGRVIQGRKLGRTLGFPTANMRIKHDPPPLSGVFAVEVTGESFASGASPLPGVANLGLRPTVQSDGGVTTLQPLLEVHLFDFSGDLYGAHLSVRFIHKLRDERKFPNFDELKAQIVRDAGMARARLGC